MKREKVFFCFVMVIFSLVLFFHFGFYNKVWGESEDAIRIGVVMDMTGPAAVMGIPFTNGFKNYFRHLNDMGGINGKKPLGYIPRLLLLTGTM